MCLYVMAKFECLAFVHAVCKYFSNAMFLAKTSLVFINKTKKLVYSITTGYNISVKTFTFLLKVSSCKYILCKFLNNKVDWSIQVCYSVSFFKSYLPRQRIILLYTWTIYHVLIYYHLIIHCNVKYAFFGTWRKGRYQ